jgi:cytochrome c biogenesis protein CcmG/thiol:disulfide interchange protein DsbE
MKYIPFYFVLLFSALCVLLMQQHKSPTSQMLGRPMPEFAIEELDSSAWKEKIAIVHVFASWCPECQIEHPQLLKLKQGGLAPIYGIAWKDKPEKLKEWLEKNGNPYETVGQDENGETTLPLGLTGVPETFIVDKRGVVRFHVREPISSAMIEQEIIPLIARLNAQ